MKSKLGLQQDTISRARELAREIVHPVQEYIKKHTTVTVERAALRLMGADNVNEDGVPVPNIVVDSLKDKIGYGVSRYYINALLKKGFTPKELNASIADGFDLKDLDLVEFSYIKEKAEVLVEAFTGKICANVEYRRVKIGEYKENENSPLLYIIVATGNIYEDVKQAQAAAIQGADIIAVIRNAAQSLLDYVPYGPTTEGFGGTYATEENFKIMREALDETGDRIKKYIRLVNYCSGLCMPEIAAMGALERLDMMLNDSMYGVLFRDINMYRTFIDQYFSRMLNSYADVVINTGEDNYLTTSDAYEKAYTVLASQFINEQFAFNAGMPSKLMGLGHAFEMNPSIKNGFLFELAQAQMVREIFPESPLKYMPPTKYMTGDIFRGYCMNTMFNLVSKATNQGIHLLGMLTEAIHTPFMQDRYLAIASAKYVMNNIADFYKEIEFKKDGIIAERAHQVLKQTLDFLDEVQKTGLLDAIEKGLFAEVRRAKNGGKGFEGVYEKLSEYWNPFETFLQEQLGIKDSGRIKK